MEQRKLQEVGGGTYTVSVPKEWAEARSLSAGAAVNLYTHTDGSLVVRTEPSENDPSEVRIDAAGRDPAAVRADLTSAHGAGFDVITVVGDPLTAAQRRAVEDTVRSLPGTAIDEATDGEVRVRDLLDAADFSVRQSVVQLRFVACTALRGATAALTGDGTEAVERAEERAAEAARLCDAIERQFNRSLTSFAVLDRLGVTRTALYDYEAAAAALRRVADESVRVARCAASLPKPLPDDTAAAFRELAETVPTLTEDAATALLAADYDESRGALDDCTAVSSTVREYERRLPGRGAFESPADEVRCRRALDGVERVVDGTEDLATIAIRRARRPGG